MPKPTELGSYILEGGTALIVVWTCLLYVWRVHMRVYRQDELASTQKYRALGLG